MSTRSKDNNGVVAMNSRIKALVRQVCGLATAASLVAGATVAKSAETDSAKPSTVLEEIVVTAQKREDRLQDVPVPVSVLSATSLLESGSTGLQDYFSTVPGLSLTSGLGGTNTVIVRGVATNGLNDNPTVGVTVDDAPYGASTFLGGGLQPIELDPNDVRQIEVLRGPQGTLYGASSLGGLLKYVTIDPSLEGLSGRVMLSTQSAKNSDGLDYGVRAALNAPIGSNVAVRISGFDRQDAGFIDDAVGGRDGVNDGHAYGGRAALLWQASDTWSVKLNVIHQQFETDAANIVDISSAGKENLETSDYVPNSTGMDRSVTFLTGRIDGRVANVDLTSITAYTDSDSLQKESITRGVFADLFAPPLGGDVGLYSNDQRVSKLSQELRANFHIGDNIDWLVGAFYTKEDGDYLETIFSGLQSTGEATFETPIFESTYWTSYEEIAAFTNLTVRFTEKFDVQFGGRIGENRQELTQRSAGVIFGGEPIYAGPNKSKDDPVTYLVTPRYKITDDLMVYARVASGYRPGGPTFNAVLEGVPQETKADTTDNYELGIKAELFDRRISIDASAYYIDWKDIPTSVTHSTGLGYLVNAGGAISKGLELALDVRPTDGLTLSAWGAWSDAYIDELPETASVPYEVGARLPFSPRFAANASIEYRRPLSESMIGNMRIAYRYVGERCYQVGSSTDEMPEYSQVDLSASLNVGEWIMSAYVNNVTDERGVIGPKALDGAVSELGGVLIVRPRTFGISLTKEF